MLTDADVETLITVGGYTHPLFTDPAFLAASPFDRRPVPGEGILLIMGGLAEQTERFDETTIALVGMDDVRFIGAAFAGDAIHVQIAVVEKQVVSDGRKGMLTMRWECLDGRDEPLVTATARMLFRVATKDPGGAAAID